MADIRAFDVEDGKPKKVSLKRFDLGEGEYLKALAVAVADANGLLPGEVGYVGPTVGPTVQIPLLKIVSDDIISTDLSTNAYTFPDGDVDAVAVKNDGTSDLTITIDTLLFTIKPGESRILELAPFDTVTFSAGAIFRLNGLRRS